jgi:hypothetical protein
VVLIVTPLILTVVTIAAVVMLTVQNGFESGVEDAKDFFIGVNMDALSVHANLRAKVVAGLTAIPIRDLYLLTRYFGWLFFGGVKRADSFIEMASGAEACKAYSSVTYFAAYEYFRACHEGGRRSREKKKAT